MTVAQAAAYLDLFAGRRDVYGVYTSGSWQQARSLTATVLNEHYAAGTPVALYGLSDDSLGHVAALDFDTGPPCSPHVGPCVTTAEMGWEWALTVAQKLREPGFHPYVNRSRRGAHLRVILDRPLPAVSLRNGLRAALYFALAGKVDPFLVELRPDSRYGPAESNNSLRAPMFPHPTTGVAAPLCDADGRPLPSTIGGMVSRMERSDASRWERLAATWPLDEGRPLGSLFLQVMQQHFIRRQPSALARGFIQMASAGR